MQVPLGVLLFNENKIHEMCQILDKLHDYVPSINSSKTVIRDERAIIIDDYKCAKILMGGDQLTVARIRGAVSIRANEEARKDRLEGIIPVVEDWHTRQVLMQVSYVSLSL